MRFNPSYCRISILQTLDHAFTIFAGNPIF